MKVLISGATGLVGQDIVLDLIHKGHEVRVLTRSPDKAHRLPVKAFYWDAKKEIDDKAFDDIDTVIHLAGESISKLPWTKAQKSKILNSRVQGTNLLKNTINRLCKKPVAVISASAVGIYGDQNDSFLSESSDIGNGFLSGVVKAWESSWEGLDKNHRLCIFRLGIVLSRNGGFLNLFERIFRQGIGGPVGGSQYLSWVALKDVAKAFVSATLDNQFHGVYNLTAENPVTQSEFCKKLASRVGMWSLPPVPGAVVKPFLGDMKELLLNSQRAVPERLKSQGFEFVYKNLDAVLDAEFSHQSCRKLSSVHWVPRPIDEVFEFFSSEKNLEEITPKFLNFKVTGISTQNIEQGSEIYYKMKIHGIPAKWTTTIAVWNPPHEFVDNQKSGPYKKWYHIHKFESMAGGTLLYDEVHFKLPMGFLGEIFGGLLVEKDVKNIFKYRQKIISNLFT